MAESRPGVEDITRPPDSTPDDIEVTNLDHFAHRLSLDVTNGAVSSASLTNGGVTSQSQSVTEYVFIYCTLNQILETSVILLSIFLPFN